MLPVWPHALGGNKREWSPRRIIVWDTETGSEADDTGATLPLASWEACALWRDKPEGNKLRERWATGTRGLELAEWLDSVVTSEQATWAFAHNQAFDLITTRLVVHMQRLGWEWTRGTLHGDAPWFTMTQRNRSLTFVDSYSHLPAGLAKLGELYGLPKLPMPAFDAPAEEWDTYRHRDVELLRDVLVQFLDWWDAEKLGNLSVSGAATGWNNWRHTTPDLQVRIETDPEVRAWGRSAIYGGRRTAWKVGELRGGPWVELDFRHAHLDIIRHEPIPTRFHAWHAPIPLDHRALTSDRIGLISDVLVHADEPRYPLQTPAGVLYPVGTFWTRLAGPELQLARVRGELLEVGRGLVVLLGRPMAAWGDWVAGILDDPDAPVPPMARVAVKGWSRTVIGKWASRTSREAFRYECADEGWRIETGFIDRPDRECTTVYVGTEARVLVRDQDGQDSQPFAYAWITSMMRLVLGELLELLGSDGIVACNTDSVVIELAALRRWAAPGATTEDEVIQSATRAIEGRLAPYRVAVKAVATELRLRTPEHVVMTAGGGELRKLASVPSRGDEVAPWRFAGETWPGISRQLGVSQAEQFRLERRIVDVSSARPLAWVRGDGTCEAPRVRVGKGGANVMLRPSKSVELGNNGKTKVAQHLSLTRMLESGAIPRA